MSTVVTDPTVTRRRSLTGPTGPQHLTIQAPTKGVGAASLQVMALGCEALSAIDPQALAVTYWFDAPAAGQPGPVSIRFSGRRKAVTGKPSAGDTFSVVETVDARAGGGRVALTARVEGLHPGDWEVTAAPVTPDARPRPHTRPARQGSAGSAAASSSGRTTYAPVASVLAPGARLGAWPLFVALGLLVGFAVQGLVAGHLYLPVGRLSAVSIVASVIGLAIAKGYYAIILYVHGERDRRELLSGACIQGFVLGAAATLAIGSALAGVPLGAALDASAAAVMFGMAVGRFGCFFGGCCAGRPTSSRWGLWSSDRRVGVRRIPVQLLESSVAAALGTVALLLLWTSKPAPAGATFVAVIAVYTLVRQLLLPLRDRPRHTAHGRTVVLAASLVLLALDAAIAIPGVW